MYDFAVVVDAGHGGSDPGAVSGNNREKDLTLQIANYMYERFKELGVPVAITRNTDETVSPTERVKRILDAFGNKKNVIVISNHLNSNTTGTAEGAEVVYALRNEATLAQNVLNALGDAGQKKRMIYQRRLPSDSSKDYYFIHRNTGQTEPLLVEYGFINNAQDLNRIKNNYRQYVDAVVDAVIATKMGGSIPPTSSNTYVVKSGDTLYKIAQNFNTTVNNLKRLNNLTNDDLSIGQILLVPAQSATGNSNTYIVRSGDSLWSIANRYNTTVDTIKRLNGLTSNTLSIGQVLAIPNSIDTNGEVSEAGTYVVKNGDTLWNIANRFDTNINEIKRLNNLSSDILNVGQVLKIPNVTGSLPTLTYTVKSGDSLWSIANRYNTTVDSIKQLNNLTSNLLSIGQVLKIPTE